MTVLTILLSLVVFCFYPLDQLHAQDPCVGGSMTLTYDTADYVNGPPTLLETQYNASYTYQWYSNGAPIAGATGHQYTATSMGNYYVRINGNGCTAYTNTFMIYNAPNLTVSVSPSGTSYICTGDTIELAAITNTSINNSYEWYETSTGVPVGIDSLLRVSSYGSYAVKVRHTDTNGMIAEEYSDTVTIASSPVLIPPVQTTSTYVCDGVGATLNTSACAGCNYKWYEVDSSGGTTFIAGSLNNNFYATTIAGAFLVEVEYPNGCKENSATIGIQDANFEIDLNALDSFFYCNTDSVLLQSTSFNNTTYTWYQGNVPIKAGQLDDSTLWVHSASFLPTNVEAVQPNGCRALSNTVSIINSNVTVDIDTIGTGCNRGLIARTMSLGDSFQWQDQNGVPILGATDSTYYPNTGGMYICEVTFPSGCVLADTLVLGGALNLSSEIISVGVCKKAPDSLRAIASGGTGNYLYHWMNGLQGDITPVRGASYSNSGVSWNVTITDLNTGCEIVDTFEMANIPVDTADYIIAPDSTLDFCLILPNGTTNNVIGNYYHYGYGTWAANTIDCYTYTASGLTEVTEQFVFVLEDTVSGDCRETLGSIRHASCVWAGDADNNQIVNNVDLLYLGMSYGYTGVTRPNAGIDYDCEPARDWNITIGNPTIDAKYADTDGNGLVNDDDTLAIAQNWGLIHLRSNPMAGQVIMELDTAVVNPGDQVDLAILMHDSMVNTVAGAYGVAFTINYDNDFIDTNSVHIGFANSWMGTQGTNLLGMYKDFYYNNQTEVAITRTDHQNVSGVGEVARMYFTIKDDVILRGNSPKLNLTITNIIFIDSAGLPIAVSPQPSQVLIVDPVLSTPSPDKVVGNNIRVYPNPSNGQFTIKSEQAIQELHLFNSVGQLVWAKPINSLHHIEADLANWPKGVYWMVMRTAVGVSKQKILIR